MVPLSALTGNIAPLIRAQAQALRDSVASASAELFRSEGSNKADDAVVKKLKQPKKRGKKEGEEGNEEEEQEEEQGGVRSLEIVKSAGEAWERLRERLKEAPIIQVRYEKTPVWNSLIFMLFIVIQ